MRYTNEIEGGGDGGTNRFLKSPSKRWNLDKDSMLSLDSGLSNVGALTLIISERVVKNTDLLFCQ